MAYMAGDAPCNKKAVGNNSDKPSIDEIFTILSDSRRRHVLSILMDHGEELTISQLAEKVASRDNGPPRNEVPNKKSQFRSEVPEDRVTRITTSLHHADIPKMDQVGLVEFDPAHNTIRATEHVNQMEHLLALAQSSVEPSGCR